MKDKILLEFNIDENNKMVFMKKHNSNELHNDTYIVFKTPKNNYLLADNSFTDEVGYSIYYRMFNIRCFCSVQEYIKLYEESLKEQKNGKFNNDFDDSYLFVCTSVQEIKHDNYFLTTNLVKISNEFLLIFVEGDFEKCKINILKSFKISNELLNNWKENIISIFEKELFEEFTWNKNFEDEETLKQEFNKFLKTFR